MSKQQFLAVISPAICLSPHPMKNWLSGLPLFVGFINKSYPDGNQHTLKILTGSASHPAEILREFKLEMKIN